MSSKFQNSLIKDCVTIGDKVAVAVSGGIDSMVLLYTFIKEAKMLEITFFVINIEHGIRGQSSKNDSAFVKNYCKNKNIEYLEKSVDVLNLAEKSGMSIEECARKQRYKVFQQLLDEKKCTKVALAHHSSDQAETVLMRIIRGTGLKGLQGMKKINGQYIRPFLDISKEEIIEMQQSEDIPFRIDETNLDNNYTRNLLRNEVIPSLKKLSLNAEKGLVRLTRIASEAESFIQKYDNEIEVEGQNARLKLIKGEDTLLFKRRLIACFETIGIIKDIEEKHLNILQNFIKCSNGAMVDMPYGAVVYKEYDSLLFTRQSLPNQAFSVPFSIGKTIFGDKTVNIQKYNEKALSNGELIFDILKIPKSAVFRNRMNGDYFTKFGGGTKSLGDYFTDKKIPQRQRDSIIVCADENKILFIAGIEISDTIKVDFNDKQNKNNIYKITVEA